MSNIEWEKFIEEIIEKGKDVNLVQICKEKKVGLNTLYRKVALLKETNKDLYVRYITLHPYKPKEIKGINFEHLMREAILTGVSQIQLQNKYGVPKRTIQRKFAKISKENPQLYEIYQRCVNSKEELDYNTIDQIASEYIPQRKVTQEETLKEARKGFLKKLQDMDKSGNKQLYKHYEEQVKRTEQQINELNRDINEGREEY